MLGAYVHEPTPGVRFMRIYDTDEHGEIARDFPLATIASWRELLGIDDPLEVIEAILHVHRHGEPEADPVTGENAWTAPYQVLRHREEEREKAAFLAEEQTSDPVQVRAVSSQAAYEAVHVPIDEGECLLDRVRRDARDRLGIPDPTAKCGESSRLKPASLPEPRPMALRMMQPLGGKAEILDALVGEEEYLLECTQNLLHALSGNDRDPLVDKPETPIPPGIDELRAKYEGGPNVAH